MRIAGWIAAGVVLGFALGTIPAERERGELEARVAQLERALRQSDRPNVLDNFLPRLGGPRRAPDAPATDEAEAALADAARAPGDAGVGTPGAVQSAPPGRGDVAVIGRRERNPLRRLFRDRGERRRRDDERGQPGESREDRFRQREGREGERGAPRGTLERFEEMAAVQRARAAASRVALIEQAGLDETQVARVDAAVERMNDQLTGYGEEMIDQMVQQEPPSPRQALGLGHDVSGILLEGQKQLEAIVGEAAQDVDPSAMEVWNYVDIEQWRPMVESRFGTDGADGTEAAPEAGGAGSGADSDARGEAAE